MSARFLHLLFLLLILAAVTSGQLITSDTNQSLIDQILHVVWEPSSLIRMWVGLDQLFNIVRSWRGVAKKLASLPFGGDGQSHVRIQEARSHQVDRFNRMYSGSSLSPVVVREKQQQYVDYSNAAESSVNENAVRLPPAFLFKPQEVFMDKNWADFFKKTDGRDYSSFLGKDGDRLQELASLLAGKEALASLLGRDTSDLNSVSSDINSVRQRLPSQHMNGFGFPAPFQGPKSQVPPLPTYGMPAPPYYNVNDLAQSLQTGVPVPGPFRAMKNLGRFFSRQVTGFKQILPFHKPGPYDRLPAPYHPPPNNNAMAVQNQIANSNNALMASKLADLQKQEDVRMNLFNQKLASQSIAHRRVPNRGDSVVEVPPEERLNMFLVLMRALGSIHTKKVSALQDLRSGLGHDDRQLSAAGTSTNRNDAEQPSHIGNFVDRDNVMASDR